MAYADNLGCTLDDQRRLRVILACGMSRSQQLSGNSGSVPLSMAMKWFLKVCMAFSGGLALWSQGDTS